MAKSCDEPGCHYPVFSKGKCKKHWQQIFGKPISKISERRQGQIKEYTSRRKLFIDKKRKEGKGKLWCPFCSQRIFGDPDIHHTMGRDDETLLDERYWHLGHNNCHVHEYHSKSYKDIPWWDGYLKWLKEHMPPEVYCKEIKKMDKS